jgi:hypothetical protein
MGDSVCFYSTFEGNHIWSNNTDSTQNTLSNNTAYTFVASQSGWYYVFTTSGKDSTYLTVVKNPVLILEPILLFAKEKPYP